MAALLGCLLVASTLLWAYTRFGLHIGPIPESTLAALMMLVACGLWRMHLRMEGIKRGWSLLCGFLLAICSAFAAFEHPTVSVVQWLHALGCGVFAYAMLWVINMHEKESGLQAIATAALVLSIGLIARPSVLILCILLSIIFFFEDRRLAGSIGGSFLLLTTPMMLCIVSLIGLSFIYYGSLAGLSWFTPQSFKPSLPHIELVPRELWPAGLGIAILLGRVAANKSGRSDLAYLSLIFVLPALSAVQWIPDPITLLDLSAIMVCGAACLIALQPPRTVLARVSLLAVLVATVWYSFQSTW
jgi:hypothetical protein